DPEARRKSPAHLSAIESAASAIPHPTSMLDRLCFTWTGLRSMDRPSVVVRSIDSANRMHTHRIRYSLSRVGLYTKSNRFDAHAMKKLRAMRNAMHRRHTKAAATSMSRRLFQQERVVQPRLSIGTKRRFSGPV